ncbi:MAG: ATP synthase subunit a [Candidatus Moranbacteria bacterium GW2011_GWF2_35_39]|nr:MAG: ATP synthase subunit a [Candidatus Moranbacteria bacterium GW2011_GWF2_35_39]
MELDISLAPEILFNFGFLPVTNTLLWSFVLSIFLIVITLAMRFSLKTIPGRWQLLFEVILDEGMKLVESIMKDEKKAKRVFPLISFHLFQGNQHFQFIHKTETSLLFAQSCQTMAWFLF